MHARVGVWLLRELVTRHKQASRGLALLGVWAQHSRDAAAVHLSVERWWAAGTEA